MKSFYTFNSVCHEERKKNVIFFFSISKSRGHVLARLKIFLWGSREDESCDCYVTKKRGKILLHQIMVKFAHKCLSYIGTRKDSFFPIPKLQ